MPVKRQATVITVVSLGLLIDYDYRFDIQEAAATFQMVSTMQLSSRRHRLFSDRLYDQACFSQSMNLDMLFVSRHPMMPAGTPAHGGC